MGLDQFPLSWFSSLGLIVENVWVLIFRMRDSTELRLENLPEASREHFLKSQTYEPNISKKHRIGHKINCNNVHRQLWTNGRSHEQPNHLVHGRVAAKHQMIWVSITTFTWVAHFNFSEFQIFRVPDLRCYNSPAFQRYFDMRVYGHMFCQTRLPNARFRNYHKVGFQDSRWFQDTHAGGQYRW